jgi:cation diffusion facilitator CzcD-associated flavoprotein CzcO
VVGLVGGGCSGLVMAVELNQMAQGASREAKDAIGSRNRQMAYRGARPTCDGDRLRSGDIDLVPPVRYSSIPSSGSFTEFRRS